MISQHATATSRRPVRAWEDHIEGNLALVKHLMAKIARRRATYVDHEDLLSAGTLGLVRAAHRFDPDRGVAFHHFAIPHITGAMMDYLYNEDTLSRRARQRVCQLEKCRRELQAEGSPRPTVRALARRMNCSPKRVSEWLKLREFGQRPLSIEEARGQGAHSTSCPVKKANRDDEPLNRVETAEFKDLVEEGISRLPEREAQTIKFYYYEGLTQQEIAARLGVTASRVCQVLNQALRRLRFALLRAGITQA